MQSFAVRSSSDCRRPERETAQPSELSLIAHALPIPEFGISRLHRFVLCKIPDEAPVMIATLTVFCDIIWLGFRLRVSWVFEGFRVCLPFTTDGGLGCAGRARVTGFIEGRFLRLAVLGFISGQMQKADKLISGDS